MNGDRCFFLGIAVLVMAAVGMVAMVLIDARDHESGIHAGIVTAKMHRRAWTQMQWIPTGKSGGYFLPIFHPEDWTVDIGDGERANRFSVRKSEWQQLEVYDRLEFDGDEIILHEKAMAKAAK